jgi:hypothetical protein
MKRSTKIAAISLVLFSSLAFILPTTSFAAPKPSPTQKGSLPHGKPFQYLNSRIDSLQTQLNFLVGRVDGLEAWQFKAELVLLQLQQHSAQNAAAIALLGSEIENIKLILQTKQDIIDQVCPLGQHVSGISGSLTSLICGSDVGANGLALLTVKNTNQVAAQSAAILRSQCPVGTVVTGGSFEASPGLTVNSAGIVDTGYEVNVANTSDALQTLNITATCLAIQGL